jgi:hypothetical protein
VRIKVRTMRKRNGGTNLKAWSKNARQETEDAFESSLDDRIVMEGDIYCDCTPSDWDYCT